MKKPFTVIERKWITNGKKKSSYQYTINESSGLPAAICNDHKRKTIHAKNKTDATMKVVELIKSLEAGTKALASKDSFGEYTKDYMLDGKCHYQRYALTESRLLSPAYMSEYRKLYENHIQNDPITRKPIASLTRADIIRFKERLVEKNGISSVSRKVFKILKQNLNYAAMMGDIPFNPAAGMKDIKDEPEERGILTMDEIRNIFPPGEYGPWGDQQSHLAFFLAYSCGLRKGEVLGLHWGKIDFEKSALRIDEAYISSLNKMGDPKKKKKRWCPVPETTLNLLKAWREKTVASDLEHLAFCYQKRFRNKLPGDNLGSTWWQKKFRTAMVAAGIDYEKRNIVPHSLRHSLNTHLLDRGYSPEKIRDTLGWSTADVQKIYTHADMMEHAGQAGVVDDILKGK